MTVQELMDAMPFCDLLEVVVRQTGHGKWLQGYRIGKDAKIYPSEYTVEEWEKRAFRSYDRKVVNLEEGAEIDVRHGYDLPMKVICKDCHKLPENIGRLEVCDIVPRHVPSFHKEALTHNEHSLDVNCYPDNYTPERFIPSKDVTVKGIDGQMSLFDLYEGNDEV